MLSTTSGSEFKRVPLFKGIKSIYFLILFFLIGFIFSSCKKDVNTTTSPPPAPTCDQGCQDQYIASGFINIFWYIWNQNIAGQPGGNNDFTVSGPQGGSVHVTGTTSYESTHGINTLHLTIEMYSCKGIGDKYSLTFNGTITADGTFSTTYKAITYACQQLSYEGTVGKDNWITDVNGTCPITYNETLTTVTGTTCSRAFNY